MCKCKKHCEGLFKSFIQRKLKLKNNVKTLSTFRKKSSILFARITRKNSEALFPQLQGRNKISDD